VKDSRYSYRCPAPPVCTARWTERDWLRFARRAGIVERRGPAPTVRYCDTLVPLARDAAGNVQVNDKGEALYDCTKAFLPVFGVQR
jgi:hypothetical protein